MDNLKQIKILYETAHAEYGSALEMLAACKKSDTPSLALGYFLHSKDEYNHTATFFSLISKRAKKIDSTKAKLFRFLPISIIKKGYVSKNGFLIDYLKIKDFIAFVYTNELLAKNSFSKILKMVGYQTNDGIKIKQIMNDELRHHGMAKNHFLKYYPALQPWQLRIYKLRETIKNKTRIFHIKNMQFLEIVFRPIYFFVSYIIGRIILLLNLLEFNRCGKNLMSIPPKSVL